MDVATHLLVPYAAALAAFGLWRRGARGDERRAALAAVFGVAGFAPDLDGLIDPLSVRFDALYFLQHRGMSHTLLFAPLFALALVGALALLARRFPKRLGLFRWRAGFLPALVLGSWTHLLLDAVTLSGVPLLWPFSFERHGLMVFHWLVMALLPPGVLVLGLHAWGKLSRRTVVAVGAAFVAVLVVLAGVRVAMRPDVEDALVYPRSSAKEWILVRELPNGSYVASLWRAGETFDSRVFEERVPETARSAVEAARATDAYRGFLLGSYSPVATTADPLPGGGWRVVFIDVAQRYEALHEPHWTPTEPFSDWGYVAFEVREGETRAVHRGW